MNKPANKNLLPLPTVLGEEEGYLDPTSLPRGTQVLMMAPAGSGFGDNIVLHWVGATPEQSFIDDFPLGALPPHLPMKFLVSADWLKLSVDQQVEVYYELRWQNGEVDRSESLFLTIGIPFAKALNIDLIPYNYVISEQKPPRQIPEFARYQREASFGSPPYHYTSSDPQIANVDQSGNLLFLGNGETTISAQDSQGQQRQYSVLIKGVRQLVFLSQAANWEQQLELIESADCQGVMPDDIRKFYLLYADPDSDIHDYLSWLPYPFWTIESNGANTAWTFDLSLGYGPEQEVSYDKNRYFQIVGIK